MVLQWGLNKIIHTRGLAQCQAHNRYSVHCCCNCFDSYYGDPSRRIPVFEDLTTMWGGREVPILSDRCLIPGFSLVCSSFPVGYIKAEILIPLSSLGVLLGSGTIRIPKWPPLAWTVLSIYPMCRYYEPWEALLWWSWSPEKGTNSPRLLQRAILPSLKFFPDLCSLMGLLRLP